MASSQQDNFLENFRKEFTDDSKMTTVDFLKVWYHYDQDKSGFIDGAELESFLKDLVTSKGKVASSDVLHQMRKNIMDQADENKDGKLEISEFQKILPVEDNFLFGTDIRTELSRDEFNKIFEHYDRDNSGLIDDTELLALLKDICEKKNLNMTPKDLEDIESWVMKVCDKSLDGKLSREELGFFFSVNRICPVVGN